MANSKDRITADELALIYSLIQEVKQKTEQLEELKAGLKARLRSGASIDQDVPFIVHYKQGERASIPWESEAKRWRSIALEYASKLNVSKAVLKKLTVTYPPVPTESLRISPKRDIFAK